MSWKDRAKPVNKTASAGGASGSWKDRAKKVEPEKSLIDQAAEAFYDAKRGIQEGIPGYGVIQKAAAGTNALIEEGLEALGADYVGEKDLADRYKELLAKDIAADKAAGERSPIANTIGNVAGSLMAPAPTKGGALGRIATNAGVAAADQATRSEELIDVERGKDAGLLAGGISAGVEALPYVGKVASAIRRAAPAQADSYKWANKAAAELSGLNPLNQASADEVGELYGDVANRRAARNINVDDEIIKVSKELQDADAALLSRVNKEYADLQQAALSSPVKKRDLELIKEYTETQAKIGKVVEDRPELYKSETKNVLTRVNSILRQGSPAETDRGIKYANKLISEIGDPIEATRLMRYRLLDARREIDDLMANKNWDNLLKNDRDAILKIRGEINKKLQKELSGADRLEAADKLYAGTKNVLESTFDKVKTGGLIDPSKLKTNLNPNMVRGKAFAGNKAALEEFMVNAETKLGAIPEMREALNTLTDLQKLVAKKSSLDIAERAAGGPTGQGTNNVLQALGAYTTGGLSLLLLPITNPAMYTRLIDAVAEAAGKVEANKLAQAMQKASKAAIDKSPDVVTRLKMLNEGEGE